MRTAGTHEGYVGPQTSQPAAPSGRLVWLAKPTSRPWPLDVVEPVAFEVYRQ